MPIQWKAIIGKLNDLTIKVNIGAFDRKSIIRRLEMFEEWPIAWKPT
jgi:hypothetical protein